MRQPPPGGHKPTTVPDSKSGPLLTAAQMERLESRLPGPNTIDRPEASAIQAGYLLGIQTVLRALREGI